MASGVRRRALANRAKEWAKVPGQLWRTGQAKKRARGLQRALDNVWTSAAYLRQQYEHEEKIRDMHRRERDKQLREEQQKAMRELLNK